MAIQIALPIPLEPPVMTMVCFSERTVTVVSVSLSFFE
jgi:hypothetical protein